MIERYYRAVLLAVILLLAAGCQIGPAPLSQQQLQEFIRERQIQPLAVEEVGGNVTVILYKDARDLGCYVAFARNGVEALSMITQLSWLQIGAIDPISATYNAILGNDIVCLTINDRAILQRAATIKISFSNNKEMIVPVKNQGNMIIAQPAQTRSQTIGITVYDENQQALVYWR